jgi:hypothetical protein
MAVCQVKIKEQREDSNFNSTTSAMTDSSSNQLTSIKKNPKSPNNINNNQRETSIKPSLTSTPSPLHPVTQQLPEAPLKHPLRTKMLKMCTPISNKRTPQNTLTSKKKKPK